MKISKICSMELIALLLCLMCFSSEGHVAKKARGYRGYRRRDISQADASNGRALKGWFGPTSEPTFEPTTKSKDEKKEEEVVLEAAEKEDKEDKEEETDAPTSSPTVEETTLAPTFAPTDIPMAVAKEDKEAPEEEEEATDSPTGMPTVEATESPTLEPTTETTTNPTAILVSEANEFTIEPASTAAPSGADANAPEAPTTQEESTVGPTSTSEPDPYYVRLEPLYMTVSLSDGDFNEENFMDVLIDYMAYNMVRDLEYFESITYGISTYSQITFIPDSIGRSQNTSDSAVVEDESPPIVSNTTVHIHLLTATFWATPTQPDLVITEYMEMLMENGELFQEYIDTETQLDAQIYSVMLEFEETVQPTNVQDNTGTESDPNAATGADGEPAEEEEENSIWQIVGITIGCFAALVWIITLWGVQSRAVRST